MSEVSYLVFDTALGPAGAAWTARGLSRIELPAASRAQAEARLIGWLPSATPASPPASIRRAVRLLILHLNGKPQDLRAIPLDLTGVPAFHRRVYEAARTIPVGKTRTYGELAALAGAPNAARAVGQALRRNPLPIVVPCHRILAAGSKLGGFSAPGGLATKRRLLEVEGVARGLFHGDGSLPYDGARAAATLAERDERLARLIERAGPFRLTLESMHSPFASLAEAIIHQQLTGKAARTILVRFRALVPGARAPSPQAVLTLPMEKLRGAGLSRAKAAALHDLAAKVLDGTVPSLAALQLMDDDAIVERLVRVRGVGRWTVEMFLIFRLGRPDVLPIHDYGLRKGLGRLLGRRAVPAPAEVARRGEMWRPFRSVASWYLWRAAELPPGPIST